MSRDSLRVEIPNDRPCCWNCLFASFFAENQGHLAKCAKQEGRWFMPRTYKCKDFYNKKWPIAKEDAHD